MLMLSAKMYDFCKKLVQIIIPAASSAYFALAEIWDLPGAEKVTGTLAVVATFLGVILGISSSTYNKLEQVNVGDLVITTNPEGKKLFSLNVEGDPLEIEKMGSIRFNVVKDQEAG